MNEKTVYEPRRGSRLVVRAAAVWMLLVGLLAATAATGIGTLCAVLCIFLALVFFNELKRPEYTDWGDRS